MYKSQHGGVKPKPIQIILWCMNNINLDKAVIKILLLNDVGGCYITIITIIIRKSIIVLK